MEVVMPRPERQLDPAGGVIPEFAAGLRRLRDGAGNPGYRKLAALAHYSATTLSDAAGGRRMPSLEVTLAFVRACGGNIADWESRWRVATARLSWSNRFPADGPPAVGSSLLLTTLARLARDGKVKVSEVEPSAVPAPRRYVITDQGASEFDAWLARPVEAEPHLQTVLFAKIVLALMLGRPAEEYLDNQRAAHLRRMRELTEIRRTGNLVDALLADHGLFHLESDLRWIDTTAGRLDSLAEVVRS
jgi:DNA-binding PadR family transcriptional regulator